MHTLLTDILAKGRPAALAVIIRQEGAAYRPLGAMMAIYRDGTHLGHVSSGCIEADIVAQSRALAGPRVLRYGAASPFMDLRLPCGGAMEVVLVPNPSLPVLRKTLDELNARQQAAIAISLCTGDMHQSDVRTTHLSNDHMHIAVTPPLKFLVFGNGYEARAFAELTFGAGYDVQLFINDEHPVALPMGCVHSMATPHIPDLTQIDSYTAITLFFHDHDLEEPILRDALQTSAFYIGAQGSKRTHDARIASLCAQGLDHAEVARIHGPIGLIPRVRDPQTLAISVLAEIHAVALDRQ